MSDRSTTTNARPGGTGPLAGRSVARIGYGAMQLERHHDDPAVGVAVLRRALELGVDHIDTAQFYGNGFVNDLIRQAIPADSDVFIASKVGAAPDPDGPFPMRPAQQPAELRTAVEDNLRALGRDSIALVNLRRLEIGPGLAAHGDQIVDVDDQLAEMIALRDEGKIGAIGISAVTVDTIRRALPAGIACVQNPYSLLDRRFENALELCAAEQVSWVPYFPLGSAFPGIPKVTEAPEVIAASKAAGVSPAQIGLAWLLGHADNTLLIPGTGDIAHLETNLAVGGIELDAATTAALDAVGAATTTVPIAPPSWPGDADVTTGRS
ncbi:aldo/keto reductase [Gordonia sp. CPCC 205515]|uniref:aldo/keto reductase n=1 Tax=Gordonia sp. CPCC 205515 TaxID=3140791 RepID=UPI003AF3E61D